MLKGLEVENEFMMSQDGDGSIDFTLLEGPNKYVPVFDKPECSSSEI